MNRTKPLRLRIGTRGSKLALQQTEQVKKALEREFPQAEVQIHIVHTLGDKILDKGLSQIGDRGLFTGALEQALVEDEIDLAVHSMKDLPAQISSDLMIAAVLPREFPGDAFISSTVDSLRRLPPHAVIGTSSLRRAAQLKHWRSDIRVVPVRGNIETRLRKMREQQLDGILLAWAGLKRLGLEEEVTQILSLEDMLPAVGQGAIGIEMKRDHPLLETVQPLDDPITHQCIRAERAFLQRLEGGCQVPLAALAQYESGNIHLKGRIIQLEGKQLFAGDITGDFSKAEELGKTLAETLLHQGAQMVFDEIRALSPNGGLR